MPAVRPTSARLLALSILLTSVLCLPMPLVRRTSVAACPVAPPVPLRILFRQSERVAVANVGETVSEMTTVPAYDGGPKMITLKTNFQVSESLKGDPSETTFVVNHWGGYEGNPAENMFAKGDRLLVFLEQNEEEGGTGYSIGDYRYGIKKLSDDDLKIYLQRIGELSAILQKEKVDDAEILEWLVRCAEEKATRWEGAYELAASMRMLSDKAEAEAAEKEQEESGEEAEASGEESVEESAEATEEAATTEEAASEAATEEAMAEGEAEGEVEETTEGEEGEGVTIEREEWLGGYGTDIEPGATSKLSDEQKERLYSALFGADAIGEGELMLIHVAKDSGDERFVPFVVKHLRAMDAEPTYDAHALVMSLAHALKDKELAALADDYCTNAPYSEYVEDEEEESSEESGEEESDAARVKKEAADAGKEKVTGVQRRREMLRAFLAVVDNKIQYNLAMQLSR